MVVGCWPFLLLCVLRCSLLLNVVLLFVVVCHLVFDAWPCFVVRCLCCVFFVICLLLFVVVRCLMFVVCRFWCSLFVVC